MTTAPAYSSLWSCPAGEVILPADAPRELWLAERRKGVGGSDMAALMGEAKYGGSEFEVWLDKTGCGVELDVTEAMEWGVRFEDAIAEKFCDDTGLGALRAGLMRSSQAGHLLVSVDRLTDDGGGLECKNQGWFMAREYFDADRREIIPRAFYWQLVVCLAVTGRSHWWLAAMIGGQRLLIRRLDRADCEADIARVLDVAESWWVEHVYADVAPLAGKPAELTETEKGSVVEASIPQLVYADIVRWRQIRREQKALTAEADEIKARITLELGRFQVLLVRGIPVARTISYKTRGRFNRKRLAKERPEIEAEYSVPGGTLVSYPKLIGDIDDDDDE